MGFYIRKALTNGPVRLNLSKGGLGLSGGVTGFRVGMSPRGPYVHGGRHGLYFRKYFKGSGQKSAGSARGGGEVPKVERMVRADIYEAKQVHDKVPAKSSDPLRVSPAKHQSSRSLAVRSSPPAS